MNKRSTPADFAGKQRTAPDAGHRARKGSAEYPASGFRNPDGRRRFAPGAEGVSGSSIRRGGAV